MRALSGLYPNEISQFAQPHLVFAAPQSSASLAAAYYQLWTGLQAEGITALLLDVCGGWHEDSLKVGSPSAAAGGSAGRGLWLYKVQLLHFGLTLGGLCSKDPGTLGC